MKCSNCSNDAVHQHKENGVSDAYYCDTCLPAPLADRVEQLVISKKPAPTQTKTTKAVETADENPKA